MTDKSSGLKDAMLWKEASGGRVECLLCSHRCTIAADDFGKCGVRQNIDGRLYAHTYGKLIANNIDPIEKKPLYHVLPGSYSYSIAAVGCNFKCSFCQNWTISQRKDMKTVPGAEASPEQVVEAAENNGCSSISYTYTEPTVFFEFAFDAAKRAKEKGLLNIFVTNGFMTKDAVDTISPYLDAANIDLKFFREEPYKRLCGGRLEPVLETIKYMKAKGIWVEVTTLVVPGENDSVEELNDIAGFIANCDKNMPWHISRFHPDYKYTDASPTPIESIEQAIEIGYDRGLKFIYPGNVYAKAETFCPECGKTLIDRTMDSTKIMENDFDDGKCVSCGAKIDGIWKV